MNLNFEISNLLFAAQVAFLLQEPADPTDRERQAGLRALRLPAGRLLSLLPALALPRHRARRVAVRAPGATPEMKSNLSGRSTQLRL